ncbi:uncharacterized protein LOC114290731 [Camellia sinensis]|uniref:uncharacterized protein LOC114290731 n=1 Tax=Camellia sinensis TaxID=4442 RepID=UPI0010358DDC|nr:uncharacterized protein LOC114290731 [Camellia sinensis]
MLLLAKSIGIHHVEVVVDLKSDIGQSSSSGSLRVGDKEKIDALRRFCHQKEKVLLSTPWANGITHVGQCSVGGAQKFRDVLCKYAIQYGFQFTYVENNTTRVTVNPRVSSDLVSRTILEIVRDKPLTQPYEVVTILKRGYGLDVSYHVVWLGVVKAKVVIHGDHSLSFDQLQWYSDAVMRYNPGIMSILTMTRVVNSFVVSLYNSLRVFLGTILVGLYYSLMEHSSKESLFPVAFVIIDSKTTTNWSWFLHELGKVVDGKRQITFISYRNLGLLEAIPKVFPFAHQGYYLQHLKNNLRNRMKGIDNGFRDHLVSSLGDCAYKPTVVGFHEKLEKLKNEETYCAAYSDAIFPIPLVEKSHFDPTNFTTHPSIVKIPPDMSKKNRIPSRGLFHVAFVIIDSKTTTNWSWFLHELRKFVDESFNDWIKEARNLPITRMMDTIRIQLLQQMSARRDQANTWNELICPIFETMLLDSLNDSRSWQVSKANEDVFGVHSIPSVTIDIARREEAQFLQIFYQFLKSLSQISMEGKHYVAIRLRCVGKLSI